MKNLKFRAWDKHEQKMFASDELIIWNNNVYANDSKKLSCNHLIGWTIDEEYLMQSTGLFDKKGVELFEGDILADLDESGDELVYLYVIYKDGKFMAVENEEHGYSADLIDCTTYHSVVGNIYENAELLGR